MRCTAPRTVGFLSDGKTISWSKRRFSREYAPFQLPCGKCISCRLEYARQWAVRCVHESMMYEQNSFLTLTYSDENLGNSKLRYIDFQLFFKRLRKKVFNERLKASGLNYSLFKSLEKHERDAWHDKHGVGVFVTGEYGDRTKRPHWHCIVFNWRPDDAQYHYTSETGHKVYTSQKLADLWPFGHSEIGEVTFESAGYVARYAAKKLVHGPDGHDYEPISKKSNRRAIGKRFLEKYWKDIFNYGELVLPSGQRCAIPRYYEKWLQANHPGEFEHWISEVKPKLTKHQEAKRAREEQEYYAMLDQRIGNKKYLPPITREATLKEIQQQRFKILSKHTKEF